MKTFNWLYVAERAEYEIYIVNEIFCHLSESDFEIFVSVVRKSGNQLLRRIV